MPDEQKKETKKTNSRKPSALKRDLQSMENRLRNRSFNAKVKTAIRSFEATLAQGDKAASQLKLNSVCSLLDKGVKTNRFKLNKASRFKSKFTLALK